jgi:hypothetical protein
MGPGTFPEVKRPGRGIDHPPPSRSEVKGGVDLYLYSPSEPSWSVLGWACHRTKVARSPQCCGTCRCPHLGLNLQWPIFCPILTNLDILYRFSYKSTMSNVMKTHSLGGVLIHGCRRPDITKLIFAFRCLRQHSNLDANLNMAVFQCLYLQDVVSWWDYWNCL